MKIIFTRTLLALLTFGLAAPALAGPFSVSPVRIYITPKDKAVAVTITNEGNEELVMQADLYTWKQKPDGEEELIPTEDLLLSPPIIKIAGKSRQVVHLARLNRAPSDRQLTYRMKVREIPEAKQNTGNLQLQIAIAFSLPVFITPPTAKYKLGCTTERAAADMIKVTCENTGNAYAQPLDFVLTSPGGELLASSSTGGYILPSIKRSFDIKSENSKHIPGGKAILNIKLDDGSKQAFDVALSK